MNRFNKNIIAAGLKTQSNIIKLVFLVLFIIVGSQVQAQIDIAGEMDLIKKTFNQEEGLTSPDIYKDADFKLFPNPASDYINIQSKVRLKAGVTITLFDIAGTTLEVRELKNTMPKNVYPFDIRKYPEGQYILGIRSVDGSFVAKKLIKRN